MEIISDAPDASIQVLSTFADGQYQRLADGESEEGFVFDGVALIDPAGRKKSWRSRDDPRGRARNRRVTVRFGR